MDRHGERVPHLRAEAERNEINRRLSALEREIEEHRRWLREEPLLRRPTGKAA